jgi:hypothetical protein
MLRALHLLKVEAVARRSEDTLETTHWNARSFFWPVLAGVLLGTLPPVLLLLLGAMLRFGP